MVRLSPRSPRVQPSADRVAPVGADRELDVPARSGHPSCQKIALQMTGFQSAADVAHFHPKARVNTIDIANGVSNEKLSANRNLVMRLRSCLPLAVRHRF